jgi:hypothetical protein
MKPRLFRRWGTSALFLVLVLGASSQPEAFADRSSPGSRSAVSVGVDEPVLGGSRLVWPSGAVRDMGFTAELRAEFSPDGTMIADAHLYGSLCDGKTAIYVHGNDGSTRQLASVSGYVKSLSWSSDQTAIAVISDIAGCIPGPGGPVAPRGGQIYMVPLNGDPATLILKNGSSSDPSAPPDGFFLDESWGVSWQPGGDSIAFIASEYRADGTDWPDQGQVWTVSVTTRVPTRFNAHLPDCNTVCIAYGYPDWSPDGSKIVAYVYESHYHGEPAAEPDEFLQYVGTVTAGQTIPVKLKMMKKDSGADADPAFRPIWSTDGSQILYAYTGTHDTNVSTRILTVASGAVRPFDTTYYQDWQPCPGAICPVWGPDPPVPPKVTLTVKVKTDKVRATATVTPAQPGKRMKFKLQRKDGHLWRTVEGKRVLISSTGRYRAIFKHRPSTGKCKVAAYIGWPAGYAARRFPC